MNPQARTRKPETPLRPVGNDHFAVFINIARHNAFIAITELSKIYSLTPPNEDELAASHFITSLNASTIDARKLKQRLKRLSGLMPFLKSLQDKTDSEIIGILKELLSLLNQFRNYYSHFNTSDFLKINSNEFITSDKILILEHIFEKSALSLTNSEKAYDRSEIVSLLKNEKRPPEKSYFYEFIENNQFSEKGIAFFFCLFLDKPNAMKFLKRLRGFKGADTKQFRATLEAYTTYCIQLPEPKFLSDRPNLAIILDGIEHLKRCPIEVYKALSFRDKKLFERNVMREDLNGDLQEETIELLRYDDRFPEFAMRFLDDFDVLSDKDRKNTYRFELQLGKKVVESKKIADETAEIQEKIPVRFKPVKAFWKLADIPRKKDEAVIEWQQDLEELYAYEPHYKIENHSIGIKKIAKENTFHLNNPDELPDAYVSEYQLRNIIFLSLESPNKEEFFMACQIRIGQIKSLYKALSVTPHDREAAKEKYKHLINNDLLPKPLVKYLSNGFDNLPSYKTKAIKKLKFWQDETESLLAEVKRHNEKYQKAQNEKKPFRSFFKSGQIATWLIKDIQHFLPLQGKLSVQKYNALQAKLALYNVDGLKEMLTDFQVYDTPKGTDRNMPEKGGGHQFIKTVFDKNPQRLPNHWLHFYNDYLNAKKQWIEEKVTFLNSMPDTEAEIMKQQPLFYFLDLGSNYQEGEKVVYFRENSPEYIAKYCQELLKLPVDLPIALSYDLVANMRKGIETLKSVTDFIDDKYHSEPTYYRLQRQYELFRAFGEKPSEKLFSTTKKPLHEIYREYQSKKTDPRTIKKIKGFLDQEQRIRYLKICDKLLVKILEKYLEKETELKGVKLTDAQGKLRLDNVLETEFEMPPYHFKVRLKDYGRYRRFVKDRRLVSMQDYLEQTTFTPDVLIKELNTYEKQRAELLKNVFTFEKRLLSSKDQFNINLADQQIVLKEDTQRTYLTHNYLLEVALRNNFISENEAKAMRWFRNGALHNQLPDLQKLENLIDIAEQKTQGYFLKGMGMYKKTIEKMDEFNQK
jgi:hypothetical protein